MSIEIGDSAPDFTLSDQHGQTVSLRDFSGRKNVLLVFYPRAFSGLCGSELGGLRDGIDDFVNEDVQLLCVAVDSMFAQRAWADQEKFEYPLLSDFWPHGEATRAYGVFDESRGVALRATFLIDKEGAVRWKVVNPISEARDPEDYRTALAGLS
ncbi:MAG: peroxiredoxin [Nocardiopsaceae bacterium]|nr:peroxiredoxin [Nocardiopsaceae bacterium]